jgi:AraC-like DNA-binding protein/ligand-binding sensor protein
MMNRNGTLKKSLWTQLADSPAVREQQSAFACATGLPLTLLPVSREAGAPDPKELPDVFCVRGCMGERSGPRCQNVLLKAEARATRAAKPIAFGCPAGLVKILVPVLIGGKHIGSLLAGPFSLNTPRADRFLQLAERLKEQGLGNQTQRLSTTWQQSPVLTTERQRAVATLVSLFAEYLAECGNRLMLRRANSKTLLMRQIETFLSEERHGDLSLKAVSERVNLSPCHFCKVFKKQTGLTFSEYRTRKRVERARQLLQQGGKRVSEIAFEAGFNSIPYFNRAFRRYVGCAPSEFAAANRVKQSASGA